MVDSPLSPDRDRYDDLTVERRTQDDFDAHFNAEFGAEPYYLEPGQSGCGDSAGEMLVATVGAGIVVTIHDRELGIGAMAYILIPDAVLDAFPHMDGAAADLLAEAFEPLESCIGQLKRLGAGKNRIRIRVMGGASTGDGRDSGTKNYILVKNYLKDKNLVVMSEDMNGHYLRRIHFFPHSGRAVKKILRRKSDFSSLRTDETRYQEEFLSS